MNMTTMNKRQDPYKVQLADIANEIKGINTTIKYYTLIVRSRRSNFRI